MRRFGYERLTGMQGLRSSSLLGSILQKASSLLAFARSTRAAFLVQDGNTTFFVRQRVCQILGVRVLSGASTKNALCNRLNYKGVDAPSIKDV